MVGGDEREGERVEANILFFISVRREREWHVAYFYLLNGFSV